MIMFSSCVSSLINKFGRTVSVLPENGAPISTKAFIQPLRHKDQSYMGGKCVDLGYLNGKNYLYIGNKNVRLDLYPFNTKIETSEENYVVKRAQAVYLGEDVLYVWAIIQVFVEDVPL